MSLEYVILPVTPLQQNATLLWDSDSRDAVITDAGGDVEILVNALEQHKVNLRALWLTHGHADHVGGVVDLLKHYDVAVIGPHEADAYWLDQVESICAMYGIAGGKNLRPSRWLKEGERLNIGAYEFEVLHIPGHTPGSVVFYHAQKPLLIAGDVLFRESIGRADFPGSSPQSLIHNIQEKLYRLPDETLVITGHGPLTTIGHEKMHNPFVRAR